MIEDARVLREGFVPSDVVHRDSEINALSRALEPVTEGAAADPVLVTGPSGTGKTTIAKFVVSRLKESVLDVASVHVNCWQSYSRYRAVYNILEGLGRTVEIHRQSTPQDELLDRLRDHAGSPVVVTLDEVDQLDDYRLVYDLYRLDGFSCLLITNSEEELLAGQIDERVRSRLQSGETIQFDRYHLDELADILRQRAEHGLVPDAISDAQLTRIADAAAGDARVGIGILRSAARRAENDGADAITAAHVDEAIPEGRAEIRSKNLESLRREQRLIFDVLREAEDETLAPKEIYSRYTAQVDDPRTKRTVRSWLQKLEQYNLVQAAGSGPNRTYAVKEGWDR